MIRLAKLEEKQDLIDFLVRVNGERIRDDANQYVECCFSGDFRKPVFIVYEIEGKIIGVAAFSQELFTPTGSWGISWVCVDEGYRNRKYGEKLVSFCLEEISKRIESDAFVILGTYPNKTSLYDKLGFFEIHTDPERGSFMMKKIKPL